LKNWWRKNGFYGVKVKPGKGFIAYRRFPKYFNLGLPNRINYICAIPVINRLLQQAGLMKSLHNRTPQFCCLYLLLSYVVLELNQSIFSWVGIDLSENENNVEITSPAHFTRVYFIFMSYYICSNTLCAFICARQLQYATYFISRLCF
jgi:hypothetical protein